MCLFRSEGVSISGERVEPRGIPIGGELSGALPSWSGEIISGVGGGGGPGFLIS